MEPAMNKPTRPANYNDIIALPENLVGEILLINYAPAAQDTSFRVAGY